MPDGIDLGKWILAPYLFTGYAYDNNVFRTGEAVRAPVADQITTVNGGLSAMLPFKNSRLLLDYEAGFYNFKEKSITQDVSQEGSAQLELNFSSSDKLTTGLNSVFSFSNLSNVDPGGELVFQGVPYNLNRAQLEAQRSQPQRIGYYARLSYTDVRFDPGDLPVVPFFDYNGFELAGEYRHPMAASRWLLGFVGLRRFDHFDSVTGDPEPFRKERSNTAQAGIRGFLGRGQPYVLRLGYGTFEYEDATATTFGGIVGYGSWSPRLGPRTAIDLEVRRRTLPSNFDTFYVNNQFAAAISRDWLQYSRVGLEVRFTQNDYGDPIDIEGCDDFRRSDRRQDYSGYVDLLPRRRAGFRLSVSHINRDSNCEAVDFDATTVGAGVTLGWF